MILPETLKLSEFHEDPQFQNRQYWYPFVKGNFKIELIYPSHKNPDIKEPRVRVFVRGDKDIYLSNSYKEEVFSVQLINQTPSNSTFPRLFISNETFISQVFIHIWERFLYEMGIPTSRRLDRQKIESNSITMKKIIEDNSREKDRGSQENWKMLSFPILNLQDISSITQRYSIQENESQYLNALIANFLHSPDDSELASLFNFSAIPLKNPQFYKFQPDSRVYPNTMSTAQIQQEIRRIIIESGIENSEEDDQRSGITIADKLKTNFNVNEYLKYNEALEAGRTYELDKENLNMGSIIFGPPGTGKTETIEKVFKPIFEKLFGFNYEMIEIDKLNEESQPGYYGARQRAVDYVFRKAFEKIQSTYKPCFVFIDEGDVLVEKNRGRNDDNEGIAAMKNYLNINRYPGVILCVCTNHDDGDFDEGIAQRRLPTVKYDYPPLKVAKIVWKKNLETHLSNVSFISSNGRTMGVDEISGELARIVAGNLGLDTINTFCKNYPIKQGSLQFSKFKKEFFQQGYQRILNTRDDKIKKANQMSAFGQRINEEVISRIKSQIESQEASLFLAYNNRSNESNDRHERFSLKIMQKYQSSVYNQILYFIKLNIINICETYTNNENLRNYKKNLKELYAFINFIELEISQIRLSEQNRFVLEQIINNKSIINKLLIQYCGDEAYDYNPKLLEFNQNDTILTGNEKKKFFTGLYNLIKHNFNIDFEIFYTTNDDFSPQDLQQLTRIAQSQRFQENSSRFLSFLTFGLGDLFSRNRSREEFLDILSRIQKRLNQIQDSRRQEAILLIERTKLLYIIDKWQFKDIIISNLIDIINLTSSIIPTIEPTIQTTPQREENNEIIQRWEQYKRILNTNLNRVSSYSDLTRQKLDFLIAFLTFLHQNFEILVTQYYSLNLTEIQTTQRKNEIERIGDICSRFRFNQFEENQKEDHFNQLKDFLTAILNGFLFQ